MFVEVTDVYLRDGLQDEHVLVSAKEKLRIARALEDAGIRRIEAGSFVNPAKVPQMANTADVFARRPAEAVTWTALALNGRGVDRAVEAGAVEISVVASASTAHSSANAGRSTEAALADIAAAVDRHRQSPVTFVAGISTAFVCPFEGDVPAARVIELVRAFRDLGIGLVGLADTLGTAAPELVVGVVDEVRDAVPDVEYSLHLHNAHGRAFDTVAAALDRGITRFDAALGGFGGCPFAPGAAGNLDTLDLVTHLARLGHDTGIDLGLLSAATDLARTAVAQADPVPLIH